MAQWMDDLEKAAFKLRDMGKKAVQEASESFERAKPGLQENLGKAREEVSDALKKAGPALRDGFCRAADAISDLREKACPTDESPSGDAEQNVEEAPAEGEKAPSPEEELNRAVAEQLKTIRAAQQSSNSISDYIRQKYANRDE